MLTGASACTLGCSWSSLFLVLPTALPSTDGRTLRTSQNSVLTVAGEGTGAPKTEARAPGHPLRGFDLWSPALR